MRVRLVLDNYLPGKGAEGVVLTLPPAGDDWYSFARVEFDNGEKHWIPDVGLDRTEDPDERVAALETAIEAAKAHNAAMQNLIERTRHDG